ncbi:PIN domain-containing protein [Candidatus Woesebacteria bacterium]|nr:PIN domain-containing protein [Candidatus Woesebacteria bacterium]
MFKAFKQAIADYNVIAIDSLVFSYYFHDTQPYVFLSEVIIEKIADKTTYVKTSVISYLETLSFPGFDEDGDKLSFIKSFFFIQPALEIVDLGSTLAEKAAELRRIYHLLTPDAVQLATAITNKVDVFITNDEHFKKVRQKDTVPILFLDQFLS